MPIEEHSRGSDVEVGAAQVYSKIYVKGNNQDNKKSMQLCLKDINDNTINVRKK